MDSFLQGQEGSGVHYKVRKRKTASIILLSSRALKDISTATIFGTPLDVICGNRLHCRLHLLALGPHWEATNFAASIM